MKISEEIQKKLVCPATKNKLRKNGDYLESVANPAIRYPLINGIPILINSNNSIFSIEDFTRTVNTTFELDESKIRTIVKRLMPKITHNIKAKKNYDEIIKLLPVNSKILVIGGSIKGLGTDKIYSNDSFEIIGSDVSFGPFTKLISDAHDIPFEDEVFDCVIVQVVLEHVLDPHRCVSEIHRVLKSTGIVYAETPFIQQVHMRQYDFTRYTHLGHRRLFRNFEEIKSGATGGPGMALAWSYTWFLRSFATSALMVYLLTFFAYITSFFLKYFDYILIEKPGSYDAASQFFFIGKKSNTALPDKELLKQFRGVKHKF
ncbi:MAG TPA: class I SAM-dependent methyltransferase [Chitinophagaceae bacterium]